MNTKGLIYVFTGEGKGKTSAALGMVVRAVGANMKVGWVSWYKEESWPISEKKLRGSFKGKLEMYFMGKGFYKLPTDKAIPLEHKRAASMALRKAEELLVRVDLLILDEVNNALDDGLIELDKVMEMIKKRRKTHVVLTGRGVNKKIIQRADLVTEMKKLKHPFDKGLKAVKGLDY